MKKLFRTIKRIAQIIANVLARVIASIFYFIFITPFGIFVRLFKDYLRIESDPSWCSHKGIPDIPDFLKKQ